MSFDALEPNVEACFPKSFNEKLEDQCKAQKGWAVPDKELRTALCQMQGELVSTSYRSFLHK